MASLLSLFLVVFLGVVSYVIQLFISRNCSESNNGKTAVNLSRIVFRCSTFFCKEKLLGLQKTGEESV